MIIKIAFCEMYSAEPKTFFGYCRLADAVRSPNSNDFLGMIVENEGEAFYYDGYSEAAALIPMIEKWAESNEFAIESVNIVRMGR